MEAKELVDEINNIVEQIIQRYKPLKIILFGSAGREEYDKVNDLDFLILKEEVPSYAPLKRNKCKGKQERYSQHKNIIYWNNSIWSHM